MTTGRPPNVLVPLTTGSEELEAVGAVNLLRRAGCEVVVAGLEEPPIVCARRLRIVPDARWADLRPEEFDALALPGGAEGTRRFLDRPDLIAAVRALHDAGRWVAAICAAPLVLQAAGLLRGRRATSHPSVRERLTDPVYSEEAVVVDGRVITSRGAGTVVPFGLALVGALCGPEAAARVAREIVYTGG